MNIKFIISILIIIISSLCIAFLHTNYILLSIILVFIAYIKHILLSIKNEFIWFILVVMGSGIIEVFLVNFSEAWTYSSTYLLGIPIWAPLFWGIVGTNLIVIYNNLGE